MIRYKIMSTLELCHEAKIYISTWNELLITEHMNINRFAVGRILFIIQYLLLFSLLQSPSHSPPLSRIHKYAYLVLPLPAEKKDQFGEPLENRVDVMKRIREMKKKRRRPGHKK